MTKQIEYLPVVQQIIMAKKANGQEKEFPFDNSGVQLIVDRCTGRVLLMPSYSAVECMMFSLALAEWYIEWQEMAELLASGHVDDDIY